MQAEGKVVELILLDGFPAAYILCPPRLIPPPGAYLLAHIPGSDSAVAVAVFAARSFANPQRTESDGFLIAPPAPSSWTPGARLYLRGPLGHGFTIPSFARRIALVAFDSSPRRLLALLDIAFKQEAAVTLVCETQLDDLPLQVEVQPLSALAEVCGWADYLAFDAARESIPLLRQNLEIVGPLKIRGEAQVLIRTPMPCGGLAECGVCTIEVHRGYQLACADGPVFDLKSVISKI
jgi:dihydroorotate dehydrogenase electron transfer subunit